MSHKAVPMATAHPRDGLLMGFYGAANLDVIPMPDANVRPVNAPATARRLSRGRLSDRWRAAAAALPYALKLLLFVAFVQTLFNMTGESFFTGGGSYLLYVAKYFVLNLLGYSPVVLTMVATSEIAPSQGARRFVWLTIALLLSSLIGALIGLKLQQLGNPTRFLLQEHQREVLQVWFVSWFPSALLLAIYEFHRKDLRVTEDVLNARSARVALDADLSKARLQALRAQIEPHFLFNTLANIRRLYQLDAAAGADMLESLIRYLAMALPNLRGERTRLREEAQLIGAYLDIYRIRMGARLAYEVVFPQELLDIEIPAMMLLTLVENAIKHGLAPLPEGGFIRVSAVRCDDGLALQVADSGHGMETGSGSGYGLSNIRARLLGVYGDAASLSLNLNLPRGVTATLRLPIEMTA